MKIYNTFANAIKENSPDDVEYNSSVYGYVLKKEKIKKEIEPLIRKKCVVCKNVYEIHRKRTAQRKNKQGRTINAKYTCSSKCARVYDGLLHHFSGNYLKKWKEKIIEDIKLAEQERCLKMIEELIFAMQQSVDCFGYKEHKVLTTNLIYGYPIEEPKTKEMKMLKDFAMGCYQNGWLEAVNQFEELTQKIKEGEEK